MRIGNLIMAVTVLSVVSACGKGADAPATQSKAVGVKGDQAQQSAAQFRAKQENDSQYKPHCMTFAQQIEISANGPGPVESRLEIVRGLLGTAINNGC